MVEWEPEERCTDCKNSLTGGPSEISLPEAMRAERAMVQDAAACVVEYGKVFVSCEDMEIMDKAWDPLPATEHQ